MIRKIKITITIITWNKHMYWCRQRTWWGTCVVSWIRNICLFNGKLWMRSPSGSCSYRNASFRVVIYHSFIMIPKNVPRKQNISMYFSITWCIIEFFKILRKIDFTVNPLENLVYAPNYSLILAVDTFVLITQIMHYWFINILERGKSFIIKNSFILYILHFYKELT